MAVVAAKGHGPHGDLSTTGGGAGASIAVGHSVLPGLVVAGVARAWSITNTLDGGPYANATVTADGLSGPASGKVAATFSELGLLVDWFPIPGSSWHAGLSGGLGLASAINQADDSTLFGTSVAGSLFGGYAWAIGPRWSLGLDASVSATTNASLKDQSDRGHDGYALRLFSVLLAGSLLYF